MTRFCGRALMKTAWQSNIFIHL